MIFFCGGLPEDREGVRELSLKCGLRIQMGFAPPEILELWLLNLFSFELLLEFLVLKVW